MDMNICCLFLLYSLLRFGANGEVVAYLNVNRSLAMPSLRHDVLRHRGLIVADLPLGGDAHLYGTGFYYTKLRIGSPAKDYYLFVDTGSDLTWLRCDHETLYNPRKSASAKKVYCDHDFCVRSYKQSCVPGRQCHYGISYGDGSSSSGYLVNDLVQLDVMSGVLTSAFNSSVVIGCSVDESGSLKQFGDAIDGLIGFGQSTPSFISQISASVPIQKTFAHCLDSKNGGGIFLLGKVETVKVKTTPLIQERNHYTISMKAIEVGSETLQVSSGGSHDLETVVDSGSTLAYIPEEIYESLIYEILSNHPDLKLHRIKETSQCFVYNESVDAGFPMVTLHFEDSLQLVVYPHDYLFELEVDTYCIGWKESGHLSKSLKDTAILGDLYIIYYRLFTSWSGGCSSWCPSFVCSSSHYICWL